VKGPAGFVDHGLDGASGGGVLARPGDSLTDVEEGGELWDTRYTAAPLQSE
jgi:hypothetical protein